MNEHISRRDFLKIAGGAAFLTAGASLLPQFLRKSLLPEAVVDALTVPPNLYFAGTDGWISMPPSPPIGFFFPDDLAPANFNTYIFGFRNITGMTDTQKANQKMKAQHSAPLFWVDQYDESTNNEFRLQLTNLGLQMRPDLTDSHTLHWHGFRNVIPFFDGEPTGSISVPVGRDFTYVFRPRDPGTYMYHCHVEDVEHVHMGMTGLVFVRPVQNGQNFGGYTKFAYNDGDGSTGYDREFAMFLSEVWAEAHWADSHIQLPDWSDFKADFSLLNGRAYPDTLAPNGSVDPFNPVRDASGDLVAPAGHPDLQYQPLSALVTCQPGERVLLRFANLGFKEAAMTMAGIQMRVIGRDATIMRGLNPATGLRDEGGADTSYETDTVLIGAGESFDTIFTAPAYSGGSGSSGQGYDSYVLYNRRLTQVSNLDASGSGGQRTEVRVYPSGLTAQQYPNDWGI
jgi:FtsP/CotA-like multicopper oxidase with cupredoxin domain